MNAKTSSSSSRATSTAPALAGKLTRPARRGCSDTSEVDPEATPKHPVPRWFETKEARSTGGSASGDARPRSAQADARIGPHGRRRLQRGLWGHLLGSWDVSTRDGGALARLGDVGAGVDVHVPALGRNGEVP